MGSGDLPKFGLLPRLQLREAFQLAKEDVFRASQKQQNPSIYENIVGAFYLLSPPSPAPLAPSVDVDMDLYLAVRESRNPDQLDQAAMKIKRADLAEVLREKAKSIRQTEFTANIPLAQPVKPPAAIAANATNALPDT